MATTGWETEHLRADPQYVGDHTSEILMLKNKVTVLERELAELKKIVGVKGNDFWETPGSR